MTEKTPKTKAAARKAPDARRPSRGPASPWKLAALVFAFALAIYANTLGNAFVWDDLDLVVDNPRGATLDAPTVRAIFQENFWQKVQGSGGYYRPVTTLSYHVDHALYGLNPAGFHATNVLLHAVASTLVFVFVLLLFRHAAFALVTALLFAAHPVHTESVAWVSGRTDLLATVWMLVSLVAWLAARRRGIARFLPVSLAAFALALLSKESAACLPLIVALLEFGPFGALVGARAGAGDAPRAAGGSRRAQALAITASFAVVLAIYLVARANVLGGIAPTYRAYAPGIAGTVALPLSILAGYAGKVLLPFTLNAEYDAPVPGSLFHLHALAGLAVLALVVYGAWRLRRRAAVVLGAGVFVLGLAPVLNVIPLGEISAERFLYFPSLGFVLVLAALLVGAWEGARVDGPAAARPATRPSRMDPAVIACALVLVVYGVRTVARNADWKDENVLFAKTAQSSPQSARAWLGMGVAAEARGDVTAAIAAYRRALEIAPDYADALSNLAGIYAGQGHFEESMDLVVRALRVAPDNPRLVSNLGSLYFELQRYDEAAAQFEKALAMKPDEREARFNLALIRFRQERHAEAAAGFEQVAGKGDRFNMAFLYLAEIELAAGNTARAQQLAGHFLTVHPRDDENRARARAIVSGAR